MKMTKPASLMTLREKIIFVLKTIKIGRGEKDHFRGIGKRELTSKCSGIGLDKANRTAFLRAFEALGYLKVLAGAYDITEEGEEYLAWCESGQGEEITLPSSDVVVSKKEYESLKRDSDFLSSLEAMGVNNWPGYGEAWEYFQEEFGWEDDY